MTKAPELESIGHRHLPQTVLGALEEYFQDAFSFQATLQHPRVVLWDAHPQEILDYYWNHPQGSILAFTKGPIHHPALDYVVFLNQPCRFQDMRNALQHKPSHTFWKMGPYLGDFQVRRLLHHETLQVIELTEKEATMLEYLCKSPNHSIDRESLLKNVWKYNAELTTHTLETHIYRLRQKLAPYENLLITTETGYMLNL